MLSKGTISKIIFYFTTTLLFLLFRMGIFVNFLDMMLCAEGNLSNDGKVTILGNIVVTFLFFTVILITAMFLL